jgi:hypothetical protein
VSKRESPWWFDSKTLINGPYQKGQDSPDSYRPRLVATMDINADKRARAFTLWDSLLLV